MSILLTKVWQASFKFQKKKKTHCDLHLIRNVYFLLRKPDIVPRFHGDPAKARGGGALTCCGTRRSPACFRRSRAPCSRCRAGSPPRRWSSPTGRSARRKQRGQMNSAAESQETGISDSVNVCPELTHTWKYTLRTKLFIKLHKRKKKKKAHQLL